MNNTVLFVISSNFQLLFSYIIKSFIKNADSKFIILDSKNKEVNRMAESMLSPDHSWSFNSLEKSIWGMLRKNKLILKSIQTTVKDTSPSLVIVFKDNDLLNCKVIETASKLGSKIILIEEGNNLYSSIQTTRIQKMEQTMIRLLGYPKLYGVTQGLHPKVDMIGGTDLKNLPESKKKNKQLIELPSNLPPTHVLNEFSKVVHSSYIEEFKKSPEKIVLYLGQPLSELGIIKYNDEAAFLEKMITLTKEKEYNLIIKPHPFEKITKYKHFEQNTTLLSNTMPAEIIPLHTNLICVLTPYSSAAVNMSVWYKIPVLYLHDLIIDDEFPFMNDMHGHFVKSYDELEEILNEFHSDRIELVKAQDESEIESLYQEFVNKIM